jgi:hypothetical protein
MKMVQRQAWRSTLNLAQRKLGEQIKGRGTEVKNKDKKKYRKVRRNYWT